MKAEVQQVIDRYPTAVRESILLMRELILSTAAADGTIGEITETLKWGEAAYLTEKTGSGSTIRLGWKASAPDQLAIYFNCRTTLVDTFRTLFPELRFDGNRAILFRADESVPEDAVKECVRLALTYHRNKHINRRTRAD